MTDLASVEAAFGPDTRLVYFETPANPNMRLVDIQAVIGGMAPTLVGTPTKLVPAAAAASRSHSESPIITASPGAIPSASHAASSPSGAGLGRWSARRPITTTPATSTPCQASAARATSSGTRVTTARGRPAARAHAS